jgi:hypothetical protein
MSFVRVILWMERRTQGRSIRPFLFRILVVGMMPIQ